MNHEDDQGARGGRSATDEAGCGHPACACAAGPGGYCSAACEAQGDPGSAGERDTCACGHAECEADVVELPDADDAV